MISKKFNQKNLNINFSAMENNKIPYTIMYIKINTSEKVLLESLSKKYTFDCDYRFLISHPMPGKNGIIIKCVDNKIVPNILKYISYLKKAQLKQNQILGNEKCSYSELNKSLNNFDVILLGKCKTFVKNNLKSESSKKIDSLLTAINKIETKKREDITGNKVLEYVKFTDLSDVQKLDILLVFGCKTRIEIGKNEIKMVKFKPEQDYKDTIKTTLKMFRKLFGANKDCIKLYGEMLTELKGYKCKIDKLDVNLDSVNLIKKIISTLNK